MIEILPEEHKTLKKVHRKWIPWYKIKTTDKTLNSMLMKGILKVKCQFGVVSYKRNEEFIYER